MKCLGVLAVLTVTACSSDEPGHDASSVDASVSDASVDAENPDPCPPLACPEPLGPRFIICGRVYDTETTTPILAPGHDPTKLRIGFYDVISLFGNPNTPPEFTVTPDSCGRFVSADATHHGMTVPSTSLIIVGIDDDPGVTPPVDDYLETRYVVEAHMASKLNNARAYATLKTTDATWSAGLTGASLVEQGVYLPIFIDTTKPHVEPYPGAPVPGISITVDGSPGPPANDFYFSDALALTRSSADLAGTQTVTGKDGSGLFVNAGVGDYSGAPLPAGCTLQPLTAKSAPGTVLIEERLLFGCQ